MEAFTNDLVIGRASWDTNYSLIGLMDEVVIFDAELTQTQITEIYNRGLNGIPVIN
jgi:hypothetical protein